MLKGKLLTLNETLNNSELETKASRETIMRLVSEMGREQQNQSKYASEMDNLRSVSRRSSKIMMVLSCMNVLLSLWSWLHTVNSSLLIIESLKPLEKLNEIYVCANNFLKSNLNLKVYVIYAFSSCFLFSFCLVSCRMFEAL